MGLIEKWWDILSGNRERRESRQAYLEALSTVAEASKLQTEMIHDWLKSFQTTGEAVKGWAVDQREEWLQEQQAEHPERFIGMPPAIEGDTAAQISWLEDQIGQV